MERIIIAAVAKNRVIGNNGKIPWRVQEDMNHFRNETIDNYVIMGRVTFESLIKPLERRTNIVVSSKLLPKQERINKETKLVVCRSIEHAEEFARQDRIHKFEQQPRLYFAGGQRIYEEAMDRANKLLITKINVSYKGDRFFPEINPAYWQKTQRTKLNGCEFITYERVNK